MKKIKILYHASTYNDNFAKWDAVGQEIKFLSQKFGGNIFVFAPKNVFAEYLQKIIFKLPKSFERLCFSKPILADKEIDLHHVFYPRLRDLRYLRFLKKPIVYTVVSKNMGCADAREMITMAKKMNHIAFFVVASPEDETNLKKAGIKNAACFLPGIDLKKFTKIVQAKKVSHQLLMATAPTSFERFRERGIYLLLNLAKSFDGLKLKFLWRNVAYDEIESLVKQKKLNKKISIVNQLVSPVKFFKESDGAIAVFTSTSGNKAFPNSIVESLAAHRPVIVSSVMPIASMIEKYNCGVVVEPTSKSLFMGVRKYYREYDLLQKNCVKMARRFSQNRLLKDYQRLYARLKKEAQ